MENGKIITVLFFLLFANNFNLDLPVCRVASRVTIPNECTICALCESELDWKQLFDNINYVVGITRALNLQHSHRKWQAREENKNSKHAMISDI